MSFQLPSGHSGTGVDRALVVLLVLLATALPTGLAAQNGGGGSGSGGTEAEAEAERKRILARADSIRQELRQPPGDRDGLTAMDMVRAPFQLFGGTLSLAFMAVVGAYELVDETQVADAVLGARRQLAEEELYVEVDFIGSRSWPALVAEYRGLDPLFFEAGYSLRRYELYGGGLELGDESTGARAFGRHHVLRELHFWGVGPHSDDASRSDFALRRTEGGAHAWSDFGGPVRVTLGSAWERGAVGRGFDDARPDLQDTFSPDTLFGAGTHTFLRWGGELDADFTYARVAQLRGVRLLGGYQVFDGIDGTDAGFHRAWGDVRAYIPFNRRQQLALRVLGEDQLSEEGEGVPFTHLADLGDDDGLRGYTSRRFRDRALLAGQAEWRYEVWWHPGNPDLRGEGFVFADYGAVAPSLADLEGSDFMLTPGFGLRFTQDGIGRLEGYLAWGGDAMRADIAIGTTF